MDVMETKCHLCNNDHMRFTGNGYLCEKCNRFWSYDELDYIEQIKELEMKINNLQASSPAGCERIPNLHPPNYYPTEETDVVFAYTQLGWKTIFYEPPETDDIEEQVWFFADMPENEPIVYAWFYPPERPENLNSIKPATWKYS